VRDFSSISLVNV
jgi:rRNA processing protein Krr1/Pno1